MVVIHLVILRKDKTERKCQHKKHPPILSVLYLGLGRSGSNVLFRGESLPCFHTKCTSATLCKTIIFMLIFVEHQIRWAPWHKSKVILAWRNYNSTSFAGGKNGREVHFVHLWFPKKDITQLSDPMESLIKNLKHGRMLISSSLARSHRVSSDIPLRKLISPACIHDLILLVGT